MQPTLTRSWIAVIAAYAVILQAILPLVAVVADPAFPICSAAHGGGVPDGAVPSCGCAAGCGIACCGVAPVEPPAGVSVAPLSNPVTINVPAYVGLQLGASRAGPNAARGPPLA
jgi:hypothetical protein